MSELDDKLNALLSDPGKMAQVMQLAQQLSGSMGAPAAPPSQQPAAAPASPPLADGLDMAAMMRFLPLLQELNHSNGQAEQLLGALRPFLKADKQENIPKAIRLARLIRIGKQACSPYPALN